MKYKYTCPSCGKSILLFNRVHRINCHDCGTSWDTCNRFDKSMPAVLVVGGLVLAQVLPLIGGLTALCGVVGFLNRR